ncbi:hypothetical protein [Niallia endozanthoxylica]|uniref:Uncharacterized protein n=1 Tax=Niallia endozanthoxylica TaxID=2036016 RepID=A0A5J5HSJ1_9BACI|nr:hypothetical protein [Niallia endozanthoxylica]KAA9023846.1 hypothetical protein F4V44_11945 [Niallia endozanthoxylica]
MVAVHFYEKRNLVLSQCRQQVPTVDENIKIKGRKGKVVSVQEVKENVVHVQVEFEKIVKKQVLVSDNKKKRR